MKNILKYTISSISMIGLLNGCGDSSQPADTKIDQSNVTTVYVERGPVIQSVVKDAIGKYATNKVNTNEYRFKSKPTYPIYASGGWIDIDGDNNKTKNNDALLDINLTSYTNNITPITTLLSESNKTKREALENKLFELFSIEKSDLYKLPTKNNIDKLEELNNAIYVKVKENNTTINDLFNYSTLNTIINTTLNNEVVRLSALTYTGTLEKHLFDTNSSLFSKVINLATLGSKEAKTIDDIESIWNISIPINVGVDYSSFNIGVRFTKSENDGSDDIGEFVYKNLTIEDNTISSPERLDIYGYGDSGSGGTWFDKDSNTDNILENSLSLSGGNLDLNLGYVMKKQTVVSESKFKVSTEYTLQIVASEPIFTDSTSMTVKLISDDYIFTNAQGMTGEITIK